MDGIRSLEKTYLCIGVQVPYDKQIPILLTVNVYERSKELGLKYVTGQMYCESFIVS